MKRCSYLSMTERYFDGEIQPGPELVRLRAHINTCFQCRKELSELEKLRDLMTSQTITVDHDALVSSILESVERSTATPRTVRIIRPYFSRLADISALASIAAIIVVIATFFSIRGITVNEYMLSGFIGTDMAFYSAPDVMYRNLLNR